MPANIKTGIRAFAVVAIAGALAATLCACGSQQSSNASNSNVSNSIASGVVQSANEVANAAANATSNMVANASTEATPKSTEAATGTIQQILVNGMPAVDNFNVTGMIMTGNQHDGADAALAEGPKSTGLIDTFYINEWISFYFDDATYAALGNDSRVTVLPHEADPTIYTQLPQDELAGKAMMSGGFVMDIDTFGEPVSPNVNPGGDGYVSKEENAQPGLYDVVIAKGGKAAYYIIINLENAI